MKRIIGLILTFFLVLNVSNVVFAVKCNEETIPLSHFIDVKKEETKSVKVYIHGNNYEIDIDKFFEIADGCMINLSSTPQPTTTNGIYICVSTDDTGRFIYISNEGGIDNGVPASGTQLKAVYTMDDVSYVNRIIELIPRISLSDLTMFDKETVERIKLYSPSTGTGLEEVGIESFFNILDNIVVRVNPTPYETGKNGLYTTVCDKSGSEGYIYITETGEIDYYSIYDIDVVNPRSTYITEDIDKIKVLFERVKPRTYATNAALNHKSEQADKIQNYEYILPMEYVNIERFDDCYIVYDKQEKLSVYSLDGKKMSEAYDFISSFNENGVAVATRDNVDYIINAQGIVLGKFSKRIINLGDYVLMNLSDENEDGRPFSYFEGEFGVYTYTGELLKVLSYEKFKPSKTSGFGITFVQNRLLFKENGKWGAIDENFNTVIEPIYDKIYPFDNSETGISIAIKDGKEGLIDRNGRCITDFIYDAIEPLYAKGGKINCYRVMQGDSYMAMQGEKYGLLDKYGNKVKELDELVPQALYEECNLISVYRRTSNVDEDEYENQYGIVDFEGNIIIPVEHRDIKGISENIILAQKSYDHMGYYDIKGNELTEFNYRMASMFEDGLAFVSRCINDVWTHEVINTEGEVVFETTGWDNGFNDGLAYIGSGQFIDTTGKVVIDNPEWKHISGLDWWDYNNDGTFIVGNDEGYGVVKYNGFVSEWAKDSVSKAKENNITESEKNYSYTQSINREDFCELVFNLISAINRDFYTQDTEVKFIDTDNYKVFSLNQAGIIYGKSETEFAPNDLLTREEAATILVRMIKREMTMEETEMWFDFDDIKEISPWASDSVQTMCNLGFMIGVGDNKFAPKNTYTVEQAIVTLMRIYEATRTI